MALVNTPIYNSTFAYFIKYTRSHKKLFLILLFILKGRGAGSLIGGYLIESIGIFMTFRVMAAVGGVAGAMYFFANLCINHCIQNKSIKSEKNAVSIKYNETNGVSVKTHKTEKAPSETIEMTEKTSL